MATGFGVICCVYDDDSWLQTMVEGCYPVVDKLFFLMSESPWKGNRGSNASTLSAIRSCPDQNQKIVVVEGDWSHEATQRNYGLELCAREGLEFCAIIDADEIYNPTALDIMMEVAKLQSDADAWVIPQITYWKSHRYRIDGNGYNGGLGIVRLGHASFVHIRRTTARVVSFLPTSLGFCHHLSYARTDEQVMKKLAHSSHANSIRPNWFTDIWRRWDEDPTIENLHPLRPSWFPRAILQDPKCYPPALLRYHKRETARLLLNQGQG